MNKKILSLGLVITLSTGLMIGCNKKEDKEETEGLKNGVGRDAIPDDEVENDATAAARDSGTNVSDIKEFAQEFLYGLSEEDANEVINELVRELEDDA